MSKIISVSVINLTYQIEEVQGKIRELRNRILGQVESPKRQRPYNFLEEHNVHEV